MKLAGHLESQYRINVTYAAAGLLLSIGLSVAMSLQGGRESIQVDASTGRPLAEAIRALEERYGWVITYEDPPFEHASDTEDVTSLVRRDGDLTKKVIVPKGFPFTFVYDLSPDRSTPRDDPKTLLQNLLADYELSGNPGAFRMIEADNVFHVVPVAVKDPNGSLVKLRSVLDARVSLPDDQRSLYLRIDAVLRAVTAASGTRIINGASGNLFLQTHLRDGADNEVARDVLMRSLKATGRKLSWQLFYGPRLKDYVLNIHVVK
jgi:hypothetical protein